MGKVITKKIQGMSWLTKTGLVLLLTLTSMVFMYEGWYKPIKAQAATNTYYVMGDTATALGADGTANLPTAQSTTNATSATIPTFRGTVSTTSGTSISWRPGTTNAAPIAMMNIYGPVYATAQDISAISASFALRSGAATDTWTMHLYDYDPAGAAQNGVLIATSSTVTTTGAGTTTAYTPTYTGTGTVAAGHRLVCKIRKVTGASSTADRIYYQGATGTTGSWITVTETAAATAGTIALSTATQSVTEATGTVTVTATRTGGSTGAVGISYATANGTATAGADYTAASGTLSWANGDTANKTFTVSITNDLINEPAETFTATLSTPTGGAVLGSPAAQTVTITDNDTAPTVQFVSASSSGNESTSPAAIVVSISGASGQTVTVNYATANVTATAGADYTNTSGTLTWLAGDTANKTINVPILTDAVTDPNETFTITLSAPVNATLGTSVHTRTITEGGGTSTIANCGGCHGYPAGTNTTFDGTRANGLFPGTHNTHVTTYNYNCSQCHRAPATTTSADFNHADGKIRLTNPINGNLNAKYGNITSWKANTTTPPFNSCSTTNCHGQLSPVWGSTASTTQCTKCHGQANAAYATNYSSAVIAPGGAGRDTGGKTLATDARVGAHQTHMTNATISRTIRCNECHTPHATVADATHLNRTTATVTFGAIAKSNSHTTAATTRTSGIITCNNTYCHTGKLNTGAAMTPAWNATGYLSASMTITDCKQCHGMPPTPLAVGSAHESVAAISGFPATTCGCHANLKSDGTTYATIFVNKAIHVDGTIDVSACDSCHGFPPTSGGHTKHINKVMALEGLGAIPAGFVNNRVCGACHNDTSTTKHAGNTPNDGTTRNIYLPTATAYQLTYQFGASAPSYDKAGTTTCSNIELSPGHFSRLGHNGRNL